MQRCTEKNRTKSNWNNHSKKRAGKEYDTTQNVKKGQKNKKHKKQQNPNKKENPKDKSITENEEIKKKKMIKKRTKMIQIIVLLHKNNQ